MDANHPQSGVLIPCNFTLLNEEAFQERFVLHVDGSVRKRATIERISERERLVSYYLPEPSPKMQRRVDLDRAIRRAEEREAKEREAMERAARA